MTVTRAARRSDIQGLRAVAVGIVVAYHFFPALVPGGFVGVDVFFVVSGFLISGLLFRELDATGRIKLWAFYSRRIRRLAPAALTTLAVTALVSALVLGPVRLADTLRDVAWTGAYLANVRFAASPEGYFATGVQSPVLHFWSLAVEEQYYLVWPVIVLLLGFAKAWRRLFVPLFVVVLAGSFALSVSWTASGSSNAYYSLPSRAWELAIGGILAFALGRGFLTLNRWGAVVAGWAGLLLVTFAAFWFTSETPFPGWAAAVPTIGAALLIWSGSGRGSSGVLQRILGLGPAQFLGNISYSLYLWHWPVLILGGVILSSDGRRARLALVVLAFGVSVLSYYFIERPFGRWRIAAPPRRVVAIGVTVALIACVVPAISASAVRTSTGEEATASPTPKDLSLAANTGPILFRTTGPGVSPVGVPGNVTPRLTDLAKDLADVFTNSCFMTPPETAATLSFCQGGDPMGKIRIVLAGDSMVGAWWPAIDTAAKANGWRLTMIGKNGCPLADVRISMGTTASPWPACDTWQRTAPKVIAAMHPDLIIWASTRYSAKVSLKNGYAQKWHDGVLSTFGALKASGRLLVLGATPILKHDPATCLGDHLLQVSACATPIDAAIPAEIRKVPADLARAAGASYFDPIQLLCTATACPVMAGHDIMFRDVGHLSATFSRALGDHLAVVIRAALK